MRAQTLALPRGCERVSPCVDCCIRSLNVAVLCFSGPLLRTTRTAVLTLACRCLWSHFLHDLFVRAFSAFPFKFRATLSVRCSLSQEFEHIKRFHCASVQVTTYFLKLYQGTIQA